MKIPIVLMYAAVVAARNSDEIDEILQNEGLSVHGGFKLEKPDVFMPDQGTKIPCHENGVVASWCDSHSIPSLDCAMLTTFDEYGCSCLGQSSACPDDCVGGNEPIEKTLYGIRCAGIPKDEPNYVLKEFHPLNRCENNAIVSSWCDDFVNLHLTCSLNPEDDDYSCDCGGRHSACPDDCVGGVEPIEKIHSLVRCKGIPVDQPNYILKED
jgi:hypothetical protein